MRIANFVKPVLKRLVRRPVKWSRSPAYARQSGARWHEVFAPAPWVGRPPRRFGPQEIDLTATLEPELPALGVLEIEGAVMHGRSGWIYSPRGHFLVDHSWYGPNVDEIAGLPSLPPRADLVPGVGLSLASEWSGQNYGHLILDSVPRLDLFLRAGLSLDQIDRVVLSRPNRPGVEALMEAVGVPRAKLLFVDDGNSLRFERLFAPSFPGVRRTYLPWAVDFLRSSFTKACAGGERRLYVSRAGCTRNARNEADVDALMRAHGFEIYNPAASTDSRRDFSEADVVVGLSGAGLADLAFCRPGARVLELIPSDHVYPYYFTLSNAAGLDYAYLVCESEKVRDKKSWGPSPSDVNVDLRQLEIALGAMLASGGR